MNMHSWKARLRYRFENTLARGTGAVIGWLALASLLIVVLAGSVISIFKIPAGDDTQESWGLAEAMWNSLMRTFDAGNMADDSGWGLRIVTLLVTIGGIFIVATLIGTISSGFEAAIEDMRKGKSFVIERNHTLILGWGPKVFQIISELLIANENQRKPRIVILAGMDKVEMEDEIRAKIPDTGGTRIICRTGSPLDLDDLRLVNINEARSIIVISPEDTESADIFVIKSILAITNNPERKREPFHIVAELRDQRNEEAARLVGGEETSILLTSDIVSKVTAQTCRQSGLSVVYTELMDFDGAEIYTAEEPGLVGKDYREILSSYEDSTVIGIQRRDGETLINPPMDALLRDGDKVMAITKDDDTMVPNKNAVPLPDREMISDGVTDDPVPERTLLMGWNQKGGQIIRELDNYVCTGSEVVVVSERGETAAIIDELKDSLTNIGIRLVIADTTSRKVIEDNSPDTFNHIILLCDEQLPVQESDARILITLLHLRNIADKTGKDLNIVSEMRDLRNRTLAEVAKADDFIVSDNMISLMLAQISENRSLSAVFSTLLGSVGSEIYIRPAGHYVKTEGEVDFYTVIESAARKGETAIGYRLMRHSGDKGKSYGINCNPVKSERIRFTESDRIIVLAES